MGALAAGWSLSLLALATGQNEGGDACPYLCSDWCVVANCQRFVCNPLNPADCPGDSKCRQECETGVVGSTQEKDTTAVLFGITAGGVVGLCCLTFLIYLCYLRWRQTHRHHGQHGEMESQNAIQEWQDKRKALQTGRARIAKEQEAKGHTVMTAKQIVDKAMSPKEHHHHHHHHHGDAVGKTDTITSNAAPVSPPASPPAAPAPKPAKTGPRGGGIADDLRIPANRAHFRQIYEDRSRKFEAGKQEAAEAATARSKKSGRTRDTPVETARDHQAPNNV